MACARAFGACVMLRDEPLSTPIPEKFEPSDYNVKALARAKDELRVLEAMDEDAKIAFGQAVIASSIDNAKQAMAKDAAENAKFEEIEKDVLVWVPPSEDHIPLKAFMLNQIAISKHTHEYHQEAIASLNKKSPLTAWQESYKASVRSVDYHVLEQRKENDRAKIRTKWVQQLRDSLK